jgi:hypothetical protein
MTQTSFADQYEQETKSYKNHPGKSEHHGSWPPYIDPA